MTILNYIVTHIAAAMPVMQASWDSGTAHRFFDHTLANQYIESWLETHFPKE